MNREPFAMASDTSAKISSSRAFMAAAPPETS
jgi:hypothetical protein